jgi:hypothetical protein
MIKWLFLPVLLLMFSCQDGNNLLNTRPSGVLSKEKMTDLFVEINLAESSLRVGTPPHNQTADSIYQKSQLLKVFEKYEVTPEDFTKSLTYYSEHVLELNEIYLEVINRLTSMGANLEGNKSKKITPAGKK